MLKSPCAECEKYKRSFPDCLVKCKILDRLQRENAERRTDTTPIDVLDEFLYHGDL